MRLLIDCIESYHLVLATGFEPLVDWRFRIPIQLRVDIQRALFGDSYLSKTNVLQANQKFYEYAWRLKPHYCEETCRPLEYSATHISHILSRGAHPEMAHDLRNFNILSFEKHNQWEDSERQKGMRIYPMNKIIISELINDYNQL
jgi:hypothetical protein